MSSKFFPRQFNTILSILTAFLSEIFSSAIGNQFFDPLDILMPCLCVLIISSNFSKFLHKLSRLLDRTFIMFTLRPFLINLKRSSLK